MELFKIILNLFLSQILIFSLILVTNDRVQMVEAMKSKGGGVTYAGGTLVISSGGKKKKKGGSTIIITSSGGGGGNGGGGKKCQCGGSSGTSWAVPVYPVSIGGWGSSQQSGGWG